jgi:hypothetical protein
MAKVVEHLLTKYKVLNSIPNTAKYVSVPTEQLKHQIRIQDFGSE